MSNILILVVFLKVWIIIITLIFYSYDFQVSDFFTRLIQRVSPKSYQQALGEVVVTQKFLENFSGDQVLST
jgi:hypothetical protein